MSPRLPRLLVLFALATGTPALAQHEGHVMPEAEHEGHAMPETGHEGHAMPTGPGDSDPHADHGAAADPHAGHGAAGAPAAASGGHHHHGMTLDAGGMVMNENTDEIPRGCPAISGDAHITVRAGKEFARARPGTMFAYDQNEWHVAPCTRLTVTLVNHDAVRHQWMIHGLPRYLYPMGMFTLEVNGPGERSATFIVPPGDQTYLVHCDVSHHMEKGMKGQLVAGAGGRDLPSIPGLSSAQFPDRYRVRLGVTAWLLVAVAGLAGALLSWGLIRR